MKNEDILNIFNPIYIISVLFCTKKYKLNDNNISKTTILCFISTIIGNITVYFLLYLNLNSFQNHLSGNSVYTIYFAVYLLFALNHTIYSILNIVNSESHVKVVKKLQQIDFILNEISDKRKLKLLIRVTVFALLLLYFILLSMKLIIDPLWFWIRGVFITMTLVFDLELIYTAYIIFFLARKVDHWYNKIKSKIGTISIREMIRDEVNEKDIMYDVFRNILDTVTTLKSTSQVTIFNHFLMQFFYSLAFIQIWIEWSQNQTETLKEDALSSHTFGVLLWVSKGFMIEIVLCICCEYFYYKIKFAEVVTLFYKSRSYTNTDRRFAKKILRDINIHFRKICGYGVFTVEAALLLNLVALLAHYTVILLQFAFTTEIN